MFGAQYDRLYDKVLYTSDRLKKYLLFDMVLYYKIIKNPSIETEI